MGLIVLRIDDAEAEILGTILAEEVERLNDWIDDAEADGDTELDGMKDRLAKVKEFRDRVAKGGD